MQKIYLNVTLTVLILTFSFFTGTLLAQTSSGVSHEAGEIKPGTFGSNFGGGNYIFPANIEASNIEATSNIEAIGQITAGTMFKVGASNISSTGLTVNGSSLVVDPTTGGNVGIGTTSPGAKLDVAGEARATILKDRDNTAYYLDPSSIDNSLLVAGKVGIGTITPLTKLHLDNDGAILAQGTFGDGWTEPNLGGGTRMLWYPRKAAFRVGGVSGDQWNDANIGEYSFASGDSTTASKPYSIAMGQSTIASGFNSTAIGKSTTASGASSTAIGQSTTASGGSSTAMGYFTTASGGSSTAMGELTTAQAYASVVLGKYNVISGNINSWVDSDPIFVIGIGKNAANRANAVTVLKNGNVGIGTTSPGAKLDVAGAIKIGSQEDIYCDINHAGNAGAIRYNTSSNVFEGCDGTSWKILQFSL